MPPITLQLLPSNQQISQPSTHSYVPPRGHTDPSTTRWQQVPQQSHGGYRRPPFNGLQQQTHQRGNRQGQTLRPSPYPKSNNNGFATRDAQPICYNCGETGHVIQTCHFQSPVKCWKCSNVGHKAKLCPF
jgi:hypothetical protein